MDLGQFSTALLRMKLDGDYLRWFSGESWTQARKAVLDHTAVDLHQFDDGVSLADELEAEAEALGGVGNGPVLWLACFRRGATAPFAKCPVLVGDPEQPANPKGDKEGSKAVTGDLNAAAFNAMHQTNLLLRGGLKDAMAENRQLFKEARTSAKVEVEATRDRHWAELKLEWERKVAEWQQQLGEDDDQAMAEALSKAMPVLLFAAANVLDKPIPAELMAAVLGTPVTVDVTASSTASGGGDAATATDGETPSDGPAGQVTAGQIKEGFADLVLIAESRPDLAGPIADGLLDLVEALARKDIAALKTPARVARLKKLAGQVLDLPAAVKKMLGL